MYRPDIPTTRRPASRRDTLAAVADVEQRKSNEMIGAELGYRYVNSPVICDMPGGPEHLFRDYEPTTWPGARLPHVWLNDGSAMQDHIPQDGFTILRLNRNGADAAPLAAALRDRKAPVRVLEIPARSPAIFTVMTCCSFVPTCTWCGGAIRWPTSRRSLRLRPGTGCRRYRELGFDPFKLKLRNLCPWVPASAGTNKLQ